MNGINLCLLSTDFEDEMEVSPDINLSCFLEICAEYETDNNYVSEFPEYILTDWRDKFLQRLLVHEDTHQGNLLHFYLSSVYLCLPVDLAI